VAQRKGKSCEEKERSQESFFRAGLELKITDTQGKKSRGEKPKSIVKRKQKRQPRKKERWVLNLSGGDVRSPVMRNNGRQSRAF